MKNITRLLDCFNNSFCNFYPVASNFLLKFATLNGQTCKDMKKIHICQVYLIKPHSIYS